MARARGDRELEQRRGRALSHADPGRTVTLIASPSIAMFTTSEVMPKLTNGNVTPVSGITARLPATVTASWHSASTTQATQSQLRDAWSSLTRRPPLRTRRGSPRVARP